MTHVLIYLSSAASRPGGANILAYYAIMRVEKRKYSNAIDNLNKHHERLKTEYKSNPDIDHSRTQQNYHLKEPAGTYREMVLNRIEETGARRRKDSVVLVDGVVTATPNWICEKGISEQREYFETALRFFENRFGKENIISAVVHMDETTPHMHLCFVPITEDNRLCAREMIGNRQKLTDLQDKFYEHMHDKYPELSRGIPKSISHQRHIPPYVAKSATELNDRYVDIVETANNIGPFNYVKQRGKLISLLKGYVPEMENLKAQVRSTEDYIKKLEAEISDEWESKSYYRSEIRERDKIIEEKDMQIIRLINKQKQQDIFISKIPLEIVEQVKEQEQKERSENETER